LTISSTTAALNIPLKAALVWTDIPYPSSQSGRKNLINDIDLLVVTPSSKAYWGNKVAGGDHLNPVEMSYLTASEGGTYNIYVKANNLVSNQAVSLAVTYPNEASILGPSRVPQIPNVINNITPSPTASPGFVPLSFNGQNFNYPHYEYNLNTRVVCGSSFTPLKSFSAHGELMLASISITNQQANNAWSLSVIITSPNGYTAQIGSNGGSSVSVYSDSNLYFKPWQFATASTRGKNVSRITMKITANISRICFAYFRSKRLRIGIGGQ
jgi:hypothetical protein